MQQNQIPSRDLSIIGCGPRGFWSLEHLVLSLADKRELRGLSITVFEKADELGSSMVYNTEQVDSNWMNLTERLIQVEGRKAFKIKMLNVQSFPSYQEWVQQQGLNTYDDSLDYFPPRSRIGQYLNERFLSLFNPLQDSGILKLCRTTVVDLKRTGDYWTIFGLNGKLYQSDEVLLTIGHQETVDDDQIKKWELFEAKDGRMKLFKSPYPISQSFDLVPSISNLHVAIRGFGLAMIDLMRGLANRVGYFALVDSETREMKFVVDSETALKFIPFSLDGLPMAPKPLNEKVDAQYAPNDSELQSFGEVISDSKVQANAESSKFLIDAFAETAATVYGRYNLAQLDLSPAEVEEVSKEWLQDSDFSHRYILSKEQPALAMMEAFLNMAVEQQPASIDYFIGQLWRHVQPTIYESLSYSQCTDEVISEIVALDERLKRYSYGPPVDSVSQMIALVSAGILNLDWVNDPNIEMTDSGWELRSDSGAIVAGMMVDSVLNQPVLSKVNSPLILGLKKRNYIVSVNHDLGILTNKCGNVLDENEKPIPSLSVLGRLAKGTIIGVDALLEALGNRPKDWAHAAAERHADFLKKEKS